MLAICFGPADELRIINDFIIFYFFKIIYLFIYLFIFRQRGWEGEGKGEKHQCVVASHASVPSPLGTWPTTQSGYVP